MFNRKHYRIIYTTGSGAATKTNQRQETFPNDEEAKKRARALFSTARQDCPMVLKVLESDWRILPL